MYDYANDYRRPDQVPLRRVPLHDPTSTTTCTSTSTPGALEDDKYRDRLVKYLFGCVKFHYFHYRRKREPPSTTTNADATSTPTSTTRTTTVAVYHYRRPEKTDAPSTSTERVPLPSPEYNYRLRNDYFDSFLYVSNRPETIVSKV